MSARTQAAYRARNRDAYGRGLKTSAARATAIAALIRLHPGEFARLHGEALRARGVEAPPLERACECGGVIRRTTIRSRWPGECGDCRTGGGS